MNVCVVNFPMSKIGSRASLVPMLYLLKILSSCSKNVCIITGHFSADLLYSEQHMKIQIFGINHMNGSNIFLRIINYIITQLKISIKLIKIAKNIDYYIFFMMGQDLIFPMVAAKLLGKKVILSLAASSVISLETQNDILSKPMNVLSKINYNLSDYIIIHSSNLIKEWSMEKYKNKIHIAHEYFLDFDKFNIKKKFKDRKNLIGYTGRLSEEKGILNFIQAIPKIIKEKDNIEFLIIGDGKLKDKVEIYLDENNLNSIVKLLGWIKHDDLPYYLNELKLLIIPSYTESGPIIALEAMACGTPILATRVGHVLNMIENENAGFIIDDNSPACIAENVTRVLEYPNIDIRHRKTLTPMKMTMESFIHKPTGWKESTINQII